MERVIKLQATQHTQVVKAQDKLEPDFNERKQKQAKQSINASQAQNYHSCS